MTLKPVYLNKLFTVITASLVLAVISSAAVNAHKYYSAMTSVSYNPSAKSLEFSHRFFAHDMEVALSEITGQELSFDAPETITPVLIAYINNHFSLKTNGEELARNWVGYELEGEALWVYEEVAMNTPPNHFEFTNTLLIGAFTDQVSTITVTIGNFRQSLSFMRGNTNAELTVQ